MGSYIVPIFPLQSVDAFATKYWADIQIRPTYSLIVVGTLRVPSL